MCLAVPGKVISIEDSVSRINEFIVSVDSSLKELYDIAVEILSEENNNYFLEEKTLDLLVVYDEIPFSGIDFECSPRIWSKRNVIQTLKDVVHLNIGFLKIKGTSSISDDIYYNLDLLKEAIAPTQIEAIIESLQKFFKQFLP